MESKSLAAKDCFIAPVLNVNAERLFLDLGGYDCFPSFRLGSFNVQWPSAITSAFDVVAGCINENNKLSCLAFEVAKQIPFLDRFTSDCTDRNQIFSCVASNIKSSLPIIGDCESFGCIASEITQEIPFVGTWVEACSEESNVILCMGNRFLQDVPIFQAVQEFFVEIKDLCFGEKRRGPRLGWRCRGLRLPLRKNGPGHPGALNDRRDARTGHRLHQQQHKPSDHLCRRGDLLGLLHLRSGSSSPFHEERL